MTPEEFLQAINELPPDERAAYEKDVMLYGRGYVRMTADGHFERIPPEEVNEQKSSTRFGSSTENDMADYPHVPAAFINAIAEEGTKAEAIEWLQKQWNETCALLAVLHRIANIRHDAAGEPEEEATVIAADALRLNEQRSYECETCRDDPMVCASVPGLRHCEKATREEANEQNRSTEKT